MLKNFVLMLGIAAGLAAVLSAGDAAAGEGDPAAVQGFYKDGFTLKTNDGKNELKLGASVQLDSRFYFDGPPPDSFDIRRARLDFNSKHYGVLAVRIQAAMEDNPYIRNALLDIGPWDALHLRVGQMKVPFSSQWLAFDNQVDFIERATAEPVYPFFDRGAMLWGSILGQAVTYNLGVFTGAGVDVDLTKGDFDDNQDMAWRLFLQPFRNAGVRPIEGLYLVGQGTFGYGSVSGRRFETRGLMAADYESLVWRWRADQTFGTNGRSTDQLSARIGTRTRWGAEVHYLMGPFTLSGEWLMVSYRDVAVYHDFYEGSKLLRRDEMIETDGGIQSLSLWTSVFLTGEKKFLDNFGWRQPNPDRPLVGYGERGAGAWEVLARFSMTTTDEALFVSQKVKGFSAADVAGVKGPAPGDGASLNAAVLEGAPKLYEVSGGLNWTLGYNVRLMLDYTYLWAPDYYVDAKDKKGKSGIVSAGNSDLFDPTVKNKAVESEHMVGLRFITRI